MLILVARAVMRHHVIDGRRCEVKKALTKHEMEGLKPATGAAATGAVNNQMAGPNQNYGPYGVPAGNMGFQSGNVASWPQVAGNVENAAVGNYGHMGAAACNSNMNAPGGHFNEMDFVNMADMLGSMIADWKSQRGIMGNMSGAPGPNTVSSVPGQNAWNMPG